MTALAIVPVTYAATVTPALAISPPSASVGSVENPRLLRLANEASSLFEAYDMAWKKQQATRKHYRALWPLAPDEITQPGSKNSLLYRMERGFEGGAMYREGEEHPRAIIYYMEAYQLIDRAQRVLRGKRIQRGPVEGLDRSQWEAELVAAKRRKALLAKYDAETKRLTKEAGYEPQWRATHAALDALADHVGSVMEEPDWSVEGLLIKARLVERWGQIAEREKIGTSFKHVHWVERLAASVRRHLH